MPVGPAAAAEERERGVDLARHEQEHEHRAEAAAAHGPLLEVHVAPASGPQTKQQRRESGQGDDQEGSTHVSVSERRFAGSVK